MSIAKRLRKISNYDLVNRVQAKTNQHCAQPGENTRGGLYLRKVLQVFVENLPEDESDIHVHVKKRDEQRWGVDTDSLAPYRAELTAVDLGLLSWQTITEDPPVLVTPGKLLIDNLSRYTYMLVTALCEAAIEAYEEGPETPYLAIINVPGYLPMAEEPAAFETIPEAWAYLASEREDAEVAAEAIRYESEEDVVAKLRALGEAEKPECGSVLASTPSYDGDHDLGLVYTVTHNQD